MNLSKFPNYWVYFEMMQCYWLSTNGQLTEYNTIIDCCGQQVLRTHDRPANVTAEREHSPKQPGSSNRLSSECERRVSVVYFYYRSEQQHWATSSGTEIHEWMNCTTLSTLDRISIQLNWWTVSITAHNERLNKGNIERLLNIPLSYLWHEPFNWVNY